MKRSEIMTPNIISTTISSYLPFSDDRLQFLDINGWDGQVIKINRQFYIELLRTQMSIEMDIPQINKKKIIDEIVSRTENIDGIYILFGEDVEAVNDGIAYIGETGNFKRRMKQHFGGYDDFTEDTAERAQANEEWEFLSNIFFFSKSLKLGGAGLGESLRKAIEAKIIQEAKNSNNFRILNRTENYSGQLNLIDNDILFDFFEKIKIILEHLGISLLKEKIRVDEQDTKNYFKCTERGADATMYRGDTGYVVLKSSLIVKEYLSVFPKQYKRIFERKAKLIEDGILLDQQDGQNYILTEDQEFRSSSGAAAFVSGGHYSGPRVWKEKSNPEITLSEYLKFEEDVS